MANDGTSKSTGTSTSASARTPPPTLTIEDPPRSPDGNTGPGTGLPPGELTVGIKVAIVVVVLVTIAAIAWAVLSDPVRTDSNVPSAVDRQ